METLNSRLTRVQIDLMTLRLPLSDPLPGSRSSMVQMPTCILETPSQTDRVCGLPMPARPPSEDIILETPADGKR